MDIYPDSQSNLLSTDVIKRLTLCSNRIYVHDDLLELSLEWLEIDGVNRKTQIWNREERVEIFRQYLGEKISFLLEIEPLAKSGIVHLIPTGKIYPRRDPNGIYFDDFVSNDEVPIHSDDSSPHPLITDEIRTYFKDQIQIRMQAEHGAQYKNVREIVKCPNYIEVLAGEYIVKEFRYFTVVSTEKSSSGTSGLLRMLHTADDPFGQNIDPIMFRNWVNGCGEKVMVDYVERLHNDLALAQRAKARFLTDLPISQGLLHANSRQDRGIRGVLNMELPFFDNVDFKSIAKARQNEIAFEELRIAMNKAIQEIPAETEPHEFQRQLDELSRDLLRLPLLKIQREKERLTKSIFRHSLMGVGTLGLYCINPMLVIPGALFTAGSLLAGIYDKSKPSQDKIRDMPGYFYWSVTHKGSNQ